MAKYSWDQVSDLARSARSNATGAKPSVAPSASQPKTGNKDARKVAKHVLTEARLGAKRTPDTVMGRIMTMYGYGSADVEVARSGKILSRVPFQNINYAKKCAVNSRVMVGFVDRDQSKPFIMGVSESAPTSNPDVDAGEAYWPVSGRPMWGGTNFFPNIGPAPGMDPSTVQEHSVTIGTVNHWVLYEIIRGSKTKPVTAILQNVNWDGTGTKRWLVCIPLSPVTADALWATAIPTSGGVQSFGQMIYDKDSKELVVLVTDSVDFSANNRYHVYRFNAENGKLKARVYVDASEGVGSPYLYPRGVLVYCGFRCYNEFLPASSTNVDAPIVAYDYVNVQFNSSGWGHAPKIWEYQPAADGAHRSVGIQEYFPYDPVSLSIAVRVYGYLDRLNNPILAARYSDDPSLVPNSYHTGVVWSTYFLYLTKGLVLSEHHSSYPAQDHISFDPYREAVRSGGSAIHAAQGQFSGAGASAYGEPLYFFHDTGATNGNFYMTSRGMAVGMNGVVSKLYAAGNTDTSLPIIGASYHDHTGVERSLLHMHCCSITTSTWTPLYSPVNVTLGDFGGSWTSPFYLSDTISYVVPGGDNIIFSIVKRSNKTYLQGRTVYGEISWQSTGVDPDSKGYVPNFAVAGSDLSGKEWLLTEKITHSTSGGIRTTMVVNHRGEELFPGMSYPSGGKIYNGIVYYISGGKFRSVYPSSEE